MKIQEAIKQQSFASEYQKLVVNVLYTGSWMSLKNAAFLKPHKLTVQQYNVLRILRGQHPKPATVNLLIERMFDKMSNASRIVDKLVEKKLVTRNFCKDDRRCVDVLITDKGLKLLQLLDKEEKNWIRAFSNLSESDAKKLNALLDKLRTLNT
jgi:DNA-binding MarR family transcriptional regulator